MVILEGFKFLIAELFFMQSIISLQKSIEQNVKARKYHETHEDVAKLLEQGLRYRLVTSHDASDEMREAFKLKTAEQARELFPDFELKSMTVSMDIQEACNCCHYKNASSSKTEGIISKTMYGGSIPGRVSLIGLKFYGYGDRFRKKSFFGREKVTGISDLCRSALLLPDQYFRKISLDEIVEAIRKNNP